MNPQTSILGSISTKKAFSFISYLAHGLITAIEEEDTPPFKGKTISSCCNFTEGFWKHAAYHSDVAKQTVTFWLLQSLLT